MGSPVVEYLFLDTALPSERLFPEDDNRGLHCNFASMYRTNPYYLLTIIIIAAGSIPKGPFSSRST
jgi:hypothetical protein